jgi:cytochrome c553
MHVPGEDQMKLMRFLLFFVGALPIFAQPKPSNALVPRGQYLATVGGCGDCHTPKNAAMEPDTTRLLSGAPSNAPAPSKPVKAGEVVSSAGSTAFHGPWGISYAANLTPDRETGMAKDYTEALFIRAMRTGKTPDGGSILPPMPWQNYAKMTDEDLKALWAYLQSIKPVKNKVKPPVRAAGAKTSG